MVANMAVVVICEALCYLSFSFKRLSKSLVVSNIASFYHEDEIFEAKSELCKVADGESTPIDGWSKIVNNKGGPINRKGDGAVKRCADADDLVTMFSLLDVHQASFPTFVAARPDRLPPAMCSGSHIPSTDASSLSSALDEVLRRLSVLEGKLSDSGGLSVLSNPSTSAAVSAVPVDYGVSSGPMSAPSQVSDWAAKVANPAPATVPFNVVYKAPRKTVCGTKKCGSGLSAGLRPVPRQAFCFVGRLHVDTTEEDLRDHLEGFGIQGAVCRKLVPKDGRSFATAAFRVACSLGSQGLLYDEANWPKGVELREWVF
jgi:hypothetical protein